ncbi:hypothetical protein [Sphingopyxis sp. EG6]|uniref:hypothetical protein n=1 Tax=Sphingopyxis sp. EG6 TaxID=1874061 RepID=UPI000DC61E18|nr:hypothetical protein [Sphingopyxis sp. EG6]BBB10738.1 LysR family transcriptional regulator [Sphingopyxis sp. EG6]
MRQLRLLFLVVITAMIGAGEARAQDRSQITRQIAGAAINIALIERERARPDVPDDFAADALARERSQLSEGYAAADRSGQGRAIRQEAQRRATRLIAAPLRTDYLRDYPDPQRVRADLAAAGNADDAELGGRQAGRFLMLASSLAGLQGNPAYLDENRWPPDVAQRARLYILHHHDIRDRLDPTFTDRCGRLQPWCRTGGKGSAARGALISTTLPRRARLPRSISPRPFASALWTPRASAAAGATMPLIKSSFATTAKRPSAQKKSKRTA